MRIYRFQVQEGYEWVVPVEDGYFEAFRAFDGSRKAANWQPIRMRLVDKDERGRRLLPSDIPWLGEHAPVLRRKAVERFGSMLAADGELLPLACDEAELFVFNVTSVVDALDLDRSELLRFPSTGRIMKVKTHVFRPERLSGVRAFKVPELLRSSLFVTDEVVRVAGGLTGVGFKLLWEGSAAAA